MGAIHFFYDWDFEAAATMVQRSMEIKPQFELSMMLAANVNLVNGNYEKSQSLVDRAIHTDPLNIGVLMNAGDLLILQRRYGEAIICLSQALELQSVFRPACLRLALAQALHGQDEAAGKTMDQAASMAEVDAVFQEYQALVCNSCDDHQGALMAARAVEQFADNGAQVLPWSLARAWAAAGDKERAIENLQRAFESHSSSMPFLGQTPVFEGIRAQPEVQRMMNDVGLPV